MAKVVIKRIDEAPEFVKGDKVVMIPKYRMLMTKDNALYDGQLTVLEYKPKVKLAPFLADIVYFEEMPNDPHLSHYFQKAN
jgi:hypothetical protein